MSQADGIRAARRRNLELLGLPPDRPHPSAAEVKKAYHQASLRVHPDKQVGKSPAEQRAAEEEFKLVAEARLFFSDIDEHLRALGLPPGSDPTQEQIDHAYWSVPHGPGSGADKALEFFQNLVSVEERIARERREPAQPPNVT
jgi:DnaJ-class molecular chaperone